MNRADGILTGSPLCMLGYERFLFFNVQIGIASTGRYSIHCNYAYERASNVLY